DTLGYLVLELEDVLERAVETVGPQMRAACRIDELRRDAHAVGRLARAAFEHVANAELATDLPYIYGMTLVGEARVAGDHEQVAKARQRRGDILDDPVGEIVLLGVAAQILERQDRDRGPLGKRQSRPGRCCRATGPHAIDPHWPSDIFQPLLAGILQRDVELAAHLPLGVIREANAAGLGHSLEARRHIHAIAEDVSAVENDVTDIDADAELDALVGRQILVAFAHAALNVEGATERVHDAAELDQHAVAGGLDDPPAVLGNAGIENDAQMLP